ncbi:Alpha-N-acetylglucosaminidase [Eumeta japonica]|uniref:Alpha-N-acetylglucosaminidase n=1 Tax=Eumeta variegata TaxID=151549 RepID=A0A4C1XCG0_EUMVA|nr:Alpha-N-acetylglucosaminidase [Eumeta japonica]
MRAVAVLLSLLVCWDMLGATPLHLDYLDPVKLQTRISPDEQAKAAAAVIHRYEPRVDVEIDPLLFQQNKDAFSLRMLEGRLNIKASSGVAAVWGFNYYLKKYLGGHVSWRIQRVPRPVDLPAANETVTANDRFRYYQNVYSLL